MVRPSYLVTLKSATWLCSRSVDLITKLLLKNSSDPDISESIQLLRIFQSWMSMEQTGAINEDILGDFDTPDDASGNLIGLASIASIYEAFKK